MLKSKAENADIPMVRYHELMRVCNRVVNHAPSIQLHGHRLTPGFIFCVEIAGGTDVPFEDEGYCLNCCVGGGGRMTTPQSMPVQPGSVLLKLPGEEPHWKANADGLLRFYICFTITPNIAPPLIPPTAIWPQVVQEVATMTEECRLNLPGWPERAGMICSVLVSRCATMLGAFTKSPFTPSYIPFLHDNVDKYIKTNLGLAIRLEDIAEYLGVSERTLTRRYAFETGNTINSRIQTLRMELACEILQDTPLPLSDIAIQIGYHHVNNFISVFHRHIGMTPREYRMIHRRGNVQP